MAPGSVKIGSVFKNSFFFPALVLIVLVVLTLLKINGSSVGMYNQLWYGKSYHDSNLISGQPRSIRSDEWLVNTPFVVSQSENGFSQLNPDIGDGEDVSVIFDVPYKDWSALFKPQNWAFFLLPLEMAFAFKWWLLGALLLIGCYWFTLSILPRKGVAILVSLFVTATPFLFWWYATTTVAPVFYTFFILGTFTRVWTARKQKIIWAYALLLAYLLSCFALVLYPPFQIPCALAMAFFIIAFVISDLKVNWRAALKRFIPVAVASLLAIIVVVAFLQTRQSTIKAILNTSYPGHREVVSGGYRPLYIFEGAFNTQLQDIGKAQNYRDNQSESSNFIALWPFLLIPSTYLAFKARRNRYAYAALAINALIAILLLRMLTPMPQVLAKLLLISSIPHNRLLIGLGVAGFLQLILALKLLSEQPISKTAAGLIAGVSLVFELAIGYDIHRNFPGFISNPLKISSIALLIAASVFLILTRRFRFGLALVAILAIVSIYQIHPLYRGLGPLTNSPVKQAVLKAEQDSTKDWTYVGGVGYISILPAAGMKTYSATYPYPNFSFWRQLDPSGQYVDIYNRYAHVLFMPHQEGSAPFKLVQQDAISVDYDPCKPVFVSHIDRILSQTPIETPCTELLQTVKLPGSTFRVYSVR